MKTPRDHGLAGGVAADDRTAELRRLIYLIVSSIADDVHSILIEKVDLPGVQTCFQVHVAAGDRGKVIGCDERVDAAIRQYVRAYQIRHGGSYSVRISGTDEGVFDLKEHRSPVL